MNEPPSLPTPRPADGTWQHALTRGRHPSSMVDAPGWLFRMLLGWVLSSVQFDRRHVDAIRDAQERGSVVHVMRSRSVVDYLYFNLAFLDRGLRLVRFANGIRTWLHRGARQGITALLRGRRGLPDDEACVQALVEAREPVLIFLHRPMGAGRNPGYGLPLLAGLIRTCRQVHHPIYLLPQLLLWDKRPDREHPTLLDSVFGTRQSPGFFRNLLYVVQNFWQSFLQLGEPTVQVSTAIDLRAFVDGYPDRNDDQIAHLLLDHLLGVLGREERVVVGPGIKPARVLREEILQDARTRTAMERIDEKPATRDNRARRILLEIAADFDLLGIKVLSAILTPIWNRIYDGIEFDPEGLERVRQTALTKRLVIVPSHKSHIDYLLLSYLFYRNGLIPPHIAAGVNLSFWPLGPLFRRCGAFFLRRTFAGDPLYAMLFNAYLVKLIEEGFSIEFFIEGTRSRTGKLNTPKYGMLNMMVDAFLSGNVDQLAFIPVSVGYENVIEGAAYRRELQGGDKESESLGALLRSSQVLASRYGRVFVEFGEPIDLGAFMREYHQQDKPAIPREDMERSVRRLAYRIIHRINDVTTVTPAGIAAMILLNHPGGRIDRATLGREAGFVLDFLRERRARLSSHISDHLLSQLGRIHRVRGSTPDLSRFDDFDQEFLSSQDGTAPDPPPTCADQAHADEALGQAILPVLERSLTLLAGKQLLVRPDPTAWAVPEDRRIEVDFYKNNIIHYFVPEAVFATALGVVSGPVRDIDAVRERAAFLSSLLKYEFCFEERSRFEEVFQRSLDWFVARGWTMTVDGAQGAAPALAVVEPAPAGLEFMRGLLLPVLEAYHLAALTLPALGAEEADAKALAKRAIAIGRERRAEGLLLHPESINRTTFENAFRIFREMGVLVEKTTESGRRRVKTLSVAPDRQGAALDAFVAEVAAMVRPQDRIAGTWLRER